MEWTKIYSEFERKGIDDAGELLKRTEESRLALAVDALHNVPHVISLVIPATLAAGRTAPVTSDEEVYNSILYATVTNIGLDFLRARLTLYSKNRRQSREPVLGSSFGRQSSLLQQAVAVSGGGVSYAVAGSNPGGYNYSTAGAGQVVPLFYDPYFWRVPQRLHGGDTVSLDVFNPTGATQNNSPVGRHFCVLGRRFLPFIESKRRPDIVQDANLLKAIRRTPEPYEVQIRMPVKWSGLRAEGMESESFGEPVIIFGAHTNLNYSTLSVQDPRGFVWTPDPVPVWALASSRYSQRFHYLPLPLFYLPANHKLRANFFTGTDALMVGSDVDVLSPEVIWHGMTL